MNVSSRISWIRSLEVFVWHTDYGASTGDIRKTILDEKHVKVVRDKQHSIDGLLDMFQWM